MPNRVWLNRINCLSTHRDALWVLGKWREIMSITKKIGAILAAGLLLAGLTACGGGDSLQFEGRALASGSVGTAYSDTVSANAEGIYYELDYDDSLPLGLYLAEDGAITGTPEEAGDFTFTIFATDPKDNYQEAEFSIHIEKGSLSYTGNALQDGTAGEPYVQSVGAAAGAEDVSYALKAGSALPAGLSLAEDGQISGVPEAAGSAEFTVMASAKGCDPVEAVFTLSIAEGSAGAAGPTDLGHIVFEGWTLPDGQVGEAYSESVRRAYGVPDISYEIKYIGGIGFPKGISFNELGVIAGTPGDSTSGVMRFNIIASAEGCEPVSVECQLRIYDVYQQTNVMEAEHIDVSSLKGAGYSGSASGLAMIQSYAKASGGKALGYLNTAASFAFAVTSAEETTANLILGLGTEWGDLTLTPKTFKVYVNGQELDYGSIAIPDNGAGNDMAFDRCTLSPAVSLKAGENIIGFEILDSEDTGGVGTATAKGPIFDCLEIGGASCEIGWRPRVANTK